MHPNADTLTSGCYRKHTLSQPPPDEPKRRNTLSGQLLRLLLVLPLFPTIFPLRYRPILPELNIPRIPQRPLRNRIALLAQYVFYGRALVLEDLQVVADEVPRLAAGARYQHRAVVVPLLRDAVRRARQARLAREGQLVGGDVPSLRRRR